MNKIKIREITATVLTGELDDFATPRVSGCYVVFISNEPDDFKMVVLSDFADLESEFVQTLEGAVSLAVCESETRGCYFATVAIKEHNKVFSAVYKVSEFRLKGLWLRLKKDPMFLEELRLSTKD